MQELGWRGADIILVTKCPEGVAYAKLQEVQFLLNLKSHQRVYFSKIGYDENIFGVTESVQLCALSSAYARTYSLG